MQLKTFTQAQKYLLQHIPANPQSAFQGAIGVKRTKHLLELLDSPQNKLKIIHIAGTSGKSSTSYITSLLLTNLGKKTGLFISPHIFDIRERIQINNKLIQKNKFTKYLNEIIPSIQKTEKSQFGAPTYFEILTALAFYIFYQEKVDYAVIETGLGGLLDATNVVNRPDKISIITKLGLDHTEVLGKTITEITAQKAGIIPEKGITITTTQDPQAEKFLRKYTENLSADLFFIRKDQNFTTAANKNKKTHFNFHFSEINLKNLPLGLFGDFQIENSALALTAIVILARRDNFKLNSKSIRSALAKANFFGRFSRYRISKKTVILDAAHNPQKMKAFINSLGHLYPGKKFKFLLAFKNTKDTTSILREIIPLASRVTITSFRIHTQDWLHESAHPQLVAATLSELGFKNYNIESNARKALKDLLNANDKDVIIITGSFYLISELGLTPHRHSSGRGNLKIDL